MHSVHIICGAAGCGKTTYGRRLSLEIGAVFLDIDLTTERLARAGLEAAARDSNDRDSPFFKTLLREAIYETLFDLALENAGHLPVVVTGPFTRECKQPDWPERLQKRLGGAPVEIHFLWCPPDVQRERIIARGDPRDRWKLANWEDFAAGCPDATPPPYPHRYLRSDKGT